MNARKYAWQILHAMIRQRGAADEGLEINPQSTNIAALLTKAAKEGVDDNHIILSLAEFGSLMLFIHQDNPHVINCPSCNKPFQIQGADPLPIATAMGQAIMVEPDEAST